MTESDLIHGLRAGEEAAFRHLVTQMEVRVYNTVLGMVRSETDADDLAQEVFIEVHRSIVKFRGESGLYTWVYRIAVNKSLAYIRSRKRRQRWSQLTAFIPGESHPEVAFETHPGVDDAQKEQAKALQDAMEKLPERQRVAFTLHKIEGLPYQEVAGVMQLSLSSVESLMHRAKKNLQKTLRAFYESQS